MSDARPPFSPWKVRLDPLLAAQETNTIFHAFRQWRCGESKPWWKRLFAIVGPSTNQAVFWMIFLSIPLLSEGDFWNSFMFPLTLIAIFFWSILGRVKVKTSPTLPKCLADVFPEQDFIENAAMDVWMTGTNGREVLEAVYLERVEQDQVGTPLVLAIVGLGCAALHAWFGNPLTPVGVLVQVGILFLVWQGLLFLWSTGLGGLAWLKSEVIRSQWEKRETPVKKIGNVFLGVGVGALLSVSFAFSLAIIKRGLEFMASLLNPLDPWLERAGANRIDLLFLALAYGGGAVMASWRNRARRNNMARVAKVLARGDYAFHFFMADVVMKDPDGLRWAHETFDPKTARMRTPISPPTTPSETPLAAPMEAHPSPLSPSRQGVCRRNPTTMS